ncbi:MULTISPECIES: glycosyltransferase family 4 protein [unclassified Tolypothrix]|uniref:glycosyltransferase family 4 protein n=1 Tax=unclassified Tolypothrix TaxID=2649714 RepID=UPI0005EABC7E|nr:MULTISPECIES: glycosyltransferase family 1 protein [unclassified Tolypothrix]BAY93867.1 group 1 glycosyl transferase [Microchaete diplosiphon NIES-3275]EKF03421.1 mannosyltransferase B family protein [Tolypothrix sp. PCC 7601]MBE9082092.1 glycosyltransferase family 4 protein [Tolypothrix sp. LEGE 11397]UYD27652.1 glycosyltransferase family 4 protein [Tolypothrix sp. PCC 7712]UYD36487.1 glycosyltransferase family 4 protein [Tolypothrix sp. PCC 7601]
MKIGFDISQTGKNKAGCGYAAASLIQNLIEEYDNHEYLLYSAFGNTFWDPEHGKSTCRFSQRNCTHLLDNLSHQDSLNFWNTTKAIDEGKLGNPDIVHANNFSSPQLNFARLVYTIHDVSFIDHPEYTSEENRWICFNGVFDASIRADLIIAISEYSRKRFLEVFPHFPMERTRVVYLGSRFTNVEDEKPVATLKPNNFWLSVGTLEPRKNLRRTLRAFKQYVDVNPDSKPLVLAGGQGWLEEDLEQFINNLELSKHIIKLGYVDDSTLKWLYKNCWAFIYPSIYEGFGLPVLEAMSLGTAVLTSHTTSLPEVGGDAVLYVDPTNEADILAGFIKLDDDKLREILKANSPTQASKFSWRKAAKEVMQAYTEVLNMPKKIFQ